MSTETSASGGWSNLWKKEDYWAIWIGFGLVVLAFLFWMAGSNFLQSIAVSFPKNWTEFSTVSTHLKANAGNLFILWIVFTLLFTIASKALGHETTKFVLGFTILFVASIIIYILGSSKFANHYNLEAPLLALILGMLITNVFKLPTWLDTSLRTEFYVKTGIVLLGATLPFTKIISAGPTAFMQATVIAVTTFVTIYFVGTRVLKLDRRFATCLAAGGSVCGVSGSIAIGSAVKADKQHVSVAISLVVVWAIVMVLFLPFMIKTFGIADGPGGAWIGNSEFADAAGMAAAASISEQAIHAFTLMKVVGRDMFIGIWCFIMALVSVTYWEKGKGESKPKASEIWYRFPKFLIGFFGASILTTLIILSSDASTVTLINKDVLHTITTLRNWAFIFTFLCIGLTTRFRDLTSVGWKPFLAFTAGVMVNVPLGYIFSNIILKTFWMAVK